MKLHSASREIVLTAWVGKVSSFLTLFVCAAMCIITCGTVGQNASAAEKMATQMEQAGARRLGVIDQKNEGFINERALAGVCALNTVEKAVALSTAIDLTNGIIGIGGTKVPGWGYKGEINLIAEILHGRLPNVGEAIVSREGMRKLGFTVPTGYVVTATGDQYSVVGEFETKPGFEDLGVGILINAPRDSPLRELRVIFDRPSSVKVTVDAVLRLLAPHDADALAIESPLGVAMAARELNKQMQGYGRAMLLAILVSGILFVAAVTLADVLIRRRDIGRRRTLGASRADVVILVCGRTVLTAAVGALLGCVIAVVWNARRHATIPIDFVLAVAVLTVLAAFLSSLPPAWYAATRDPVRVMRTP